MPRSYSTTTLEHINATSADELPLLLLEIDHPQLTQPARVVNDTQDLTSNGNLFVGMAFSASLPDDKPQQMPKARLAIDNVGKELVSWLEMSQGGRGSTCRMMQVMRSAPNLIELEITLDIMNVIITATTVEADLGFDDLLGRMSTPYSYRPDTAPGLF